MATASKDSKVGGISASSPIRRAALNELIASLKPVKVDVPSSIRISR